MLKKSITFEDFNEETVTEEHYFNLTKAECVEMEMSHKGGLKESLEKIVADEDGSQIIEEMRNIILKAYGVRSSDGKRFIKTQTLRDEFESSGAYSALFMEMVTKADAAAEFITGIMPKDMIDENQIQMAMADALGTKPPEPNGDRYPDGVEIKPTTLTREEAIEMDGDELRSGLATGRYILSNV